MPWSKHSDQRYEATRGDVLAAVGPQSPNPLSGPDDPDPFGVNEHPWTDYFIAVRIAEINRIRCPNGQVGRAIKRNRLRALLTEMVADGTIIGRPRKEWAATGRESPSRASDILYAHPALAHRWEREDSVPRETREEENDMAEQTPLTVSVQLNVTINDLADWTTAFGIEGRDAIRRDVKEYVLNLVQGAGVFGNGEVGADVNLKR